MADKKIHWEGDSLKVLRSFPEAPKRDLGHGLELLQRGESPLDAKPMKTGMPGAWELRAKDVSGQYRVIYVVIVKGAIHVLHSFKKTSAQTSRKDLQTAQERYARVFRDN